MGDERRLIAYEIDDYTEIQLTAAPVTRTWMDQTPQRYAYRCLPLSIANQAGWLLHSPVTFTATWDGGPTDANVRIDFDSADAPTDPGNWVFSLDSDMAGEMAQKRDGRVVSHFGAGTITFKLPFLFRTPPGINLWVKGPTNWFKDGIQPLEGIVETDWTPSTFTMNWKLTRAHYPVQFAKGEPFCMIVPVPRGLAESLDPVRVPLANNAELHGAYRSWLKSRDSFMEGLAQNDPETVRRGWQRDYHHGVAPSGARAPEHQTRLALKEFTRPGPDGNRDA